MTDLIKIRRDTAANWTSSNPTLGLGEPGYETDTKKMKIGDASTAWTSLAYALSGYQGQYVSGRAYVPGQVVACGPYLWTPRVATTNAPCAEAGNISSWTVAGTGYSLIGDELQMVKYATSKNVTAYAPNTTSGWQSLTLAASVMCDGKADILQMGFVDTTLATTTNPTNGSVATSFYGIGFDLYNVQITFYGGATSTNQSQWDNVGMHTTGMRYQTREVKFSVSGGTLTIGYGPLSASFTAPSNTSGRMVIRAFSGGVPGLFGVTGAPAALGGNTDWRRLGEVIDQT